ncbi:MAG TPA: FCD domain-containing protein [Anaerolineales bacterium]|nr:FCD domain-containing protein [Anaerolineales bacterium]HRQ91350.1 FCD domain-containing protein [Anaerolineales bacterium]
MLKETTSFDFIKYLANGNGGDRLPSLQELSAEHGVSISVLREQLQVARALGFVEVRPRTGIKRLPYTFAPAVRESLFYAIDRDQAAFASFSDVRRHLERVYWFEAVQRLTPEDVEHLRSLVNRAQGMLKAEPIRVPHAEHRELHLVIYQHLQNPFVIGLLEAYWEAYEQVGLSLYTGLEYQLQVWDSHRQIVEAIAEKDFVRGHQLLVGHFDLIDKRNE